MGNKFPVLRPQINFGTSENYSLFLRSFQIIKISICVVVVLLMAIVVVNKDILKKAINELEY